MISPVTDSLAYCNDETTWTDFDTALRYMENKQMDGIALALKSGITFIDLDHVINCNTGEIENETAKIILDTFPKTYTELSASRTGIHIIAHGGLPENARNRNSNFGIDIEMYEKGRFVCFTGDVWDKRTKLLDCLKEIASVSRIYVGQHPKKLPPKSNQYGAINCSDTELIDQILNSRQSDKFSRLYAGETNGYGSHSQADSAFIWMLAFWTRDHEQIDRIFRSSGLFRPKWDRRLYNTTYGDDMITTALMHVKCRKELEAY